jgi:hypothetical protein
MFAFSREKYYRLYTQYSIGNGLMLGGAFLTGKVSYWFIIVVLIGGWYRGQAFLMLVEGMAKDLEHQHNNQRVYRER